ncbi:preprotein translocase subunit SecG [uncultured Shewanella sp.]|uniref:preprotein translocase subunit SecG n=1 Tax=uncultured Shewanella sp. TaxID=173975 RepID=UPI00261F9B67|nr:preprotein translocase subunit SecG [uncultured Shewanella sp.]
MYEVLMVVYLLVALGLIGLILIQQGKGADMGASFGAGASATLFGSSGSGNFLTRSTAVLAIAFFALSLTIGNLSANHTKAADEWNDLGKDVAPATEQVQQKTDNSENTENNTSIPD